MPPHGHRPVVHGRDRRAGARPRPRGGARAHLQGRGHLRGRVRGRDALLLLGLGAHAPCTRCGSPDRPAVAILGSGPNRIGQGIEFDYCCVHAAMTVRESGPRRGDDQLQPGDGLHRLRHLRPALLRAAHARGRARRARAGAPGGRDRPVRRPDPAQAGARPRRRRRAAARHPGRLDPPGRGPPELQRACSTSSGCAARRTPPPPGPTRRSTPPRSVGYPLLVRPVVRARRPGHGDLLLGRRPAPTTCERVGGDLPGSGEIFLDRFLENAIEIDVDALCDGQEVRIGAIMQHVEEAGVHSGDSACVIPAMSLGPVDAAPGRGGHRRRSRCDSG